MANLAGKTEIPVGTSIRIIKGDLEGATGKITHAFGCYGFYDRGAIAGMWLDDCKKWSCAEEVNLFPKDFEVIESNSPESNDDCTCGKTSCSQCFPYDPVDVISAGYEWTCGKCDELMKEIEFKEIVECSECGTKFETNPAGPEHAYG